MTRAKANFDTHVFQASEAIEIYRFLEKNGYKANFSLRYVWVAVISALDHYVSELIVEKALESFASNSALTGRILNEEVPLSHVVRMKGSSPGEALLEFKALITQCVRFRTFQKADDVADGLAFIWGEQHKWDKIGLALGMNGKQARRKLNSIATRRDLIVHNADFNPSTNVLTECSLIDAIRAREYVLSVVTAIDSLT